MSMHQPNPQRYGTMTFQRCGTRGLRLPALGLGLWQNFGDLEPFERQRAIIHTAFDHGIVHFDLASTYGPPFGRAEETFGRILRQDLAPHRQELIIATKAGHRRPDGPASPYFWDGSRKSLLSCLEASLKRLGVEYVDIFYLHHPDPDTPLEESMGALSDAVRQGKALYAAIDGQPPAQIRRATEILERMGTPCLLALESYTMFHRQIEAQDGVLDTVGRLGLGFLAYGPLFQGLLTDKYLQGTWQDHAPQPQAPAESRLGRRRGSGTLDHQFLWPEVFDQLRALHAVAQRRGQKLSQMAIAWALRDPRVTGAIVGASRPSQVIENCGALAQRSFTTEELTEIRDILEGPDRARAARQAAGGGAPVP